MEPAEAEIQPVVDGLQDAGELQRLATGRATLGPNERNELKKSSGIFKNQFEERLDIRSSLKD